MGKNIIEDNIRRKTAKMIFLSKKQENKKESVKSKPMLVKLKLIIGAGGAAMTPPLGPILGQYGINIMEFCNEFNKETQEIFEKGIALRVYLYINTMKAFYFEIEMPKISIILKEYYKKEFEVAKEGKIYIEKEKLLKDVFKIAVLSSTYNKDIKSWEEIERKSLEIKVKEILGTCRSCKIYIKE